MLNDLELGMEEIFGNKFSNYVPKNLIDLKDMRDPIFEIYKKRIDMIYFYVKAILKKNKGLMKEGSIFIFNENSLRPFVFPYKYHDSQQAYRFYLFMKSCVSIFRSTHYIVASEVSLDGKKCFAFESVTVSSVKTYFYSIKKEGNILEKIELDYDFNEKKGGCFFCFIPEKYIPNSLPKEIIDKIISNVGNYLGINTSFCSFRPIF